MTCHMKNEAMRLIVSKIVNVQNSYCTRFCVVACSAHLFCVTHMYRHMHIFDIDEGFVLPTKNTLHVHLFAEVWK